MSRFTHFACIDWSGQTVARPKGIALALCEAGNEAPVLIEPVGGWSREAVLGWLLDQADTGENVLIGIDFSAALPFVDAGAYFPGWNESPTDARALWRLVDSVCAREPHLAASAFLLHLEAGRHFRRMAGRTVIVGDAFEPGLGRLRLVERRCRGGGHGPAISSFNLIGAAQVGKSSLTGMRLLHQLDGKVPVWPFDPVPPAGPLVVELYTSIAARTAGVPRGRSKLRAPESLDAALSQLDSKPHHPFIRTDDHATDAILGAAWLRLAASEAELWAPNGLSPELAQTEGWTFGVP